MHIEIVISYHIISTCKTCVSSLWQFGDILVSTVVAVGDQPNRQVSAAANDDDDQFADFASFQSSSLPSLVPQPTISHSLPRTEAIDATFGEISAAAKQQPTFGSSLSISDGSLMALSSTGVSDKYEMIKQLASNPSLFASGPQPAASELIEDGSSNWSDFQGLSVANIHSGIASSLDTNFRPSSSPGDGDWADFPVSYTHLTLPTNREV